MTPRFDSFPALTPTGFASVAYVEWAGREASRTIVCVHGLTRNARDFDRLALALASEGLRIVAIDIPGRGMSEWLQRSEDYGYPLYLSVCAALVARLGVREIDWIGTSMGGLIGMMLAAQRGAPLRRLVLNDIGPFIPKAALERLAEYVGADPRFDDLAAVDVYLRRVSAPFGPLGDDEWAHLARHSAAPADGGGLRLHYDPQIGAAFKAKPIEDVELWRVWEAVGCPTLVIRGAESDLLLPETLVEMKQRGLAASRGLVQSVEFARCGHAPALMSTDQIDAVRRFLVES